ncbi:MAG: ComEC family competence protein [Alistipes senegalensis]|nr:ComEC family competence protein [Bacteroides cellulosilyticus]MCM1351899.1 ComEC family competence protein [Alistipes senegalensis]
MPVMKALVPFVIGIAAADYWTLPFWFVVAAAIAAGVLAALFRSAWAMIVMLAAVGFGQAEFRRHACTVPREVKTEFDLRIEGIPSDRGRYFSVEAVAAAWRDPASGEWFAADDRLMLYADTLVGLAHGERIRCRGRIRDFRGGAESYRRLMRRRGFAGTMWVGERNVSARRPGENSLHAGAVERLARLELSENAAALVRAMAAGDRSLLASDLRTRYSRAGFSHLLAVSGLHTGIVFGLIYVLLGWLLLLRRGHLFYYVCSAAAVWLFVAAAGFPPSAVRAAVMFTLVQGALFAGRELAALNSLAVAAFVMLFWQPAWLGDISFQLSFLAVGFLLAWGVPLQRRLRTRWRPVNVLVGSWVVGLTAGLATAPLVAHTFGIVPLAGILTGPLVILPAAVIVLCGTVWMLLPLPFLAPLVGGCVEIAAWTLDALTRIVAGLPGGYVEWRPDGWTTLGIYLSLLAATLFAWAFAQRGAKAGCFR